MSSRVSQEFKFVLSLFLTERQNPNSQQVRKQLDASHQNEACEDKANGEEKPHRCKSSCGGANSTTQNFSTRMFAPASVCALLLHNICYQKVTRGRRNQKVTRGNKTYLCEPFGTTPARGVALQSPQGPTPSKEQLVK